MIRATTIALSLAAFAISVPQKAVAEQPQLLRSGGVLSGELALVAGHAEGKRVTMYQITSEPRKLPGPDGLCNLETGPETFKLVTRGDGDEKVLKKLVGKTISIQAKELACPQGPADIADAVVKSWALAQ